MRYLHADEPWPRLYLLAEISLVGYKERKTGVIPFYLGFFETGAALKAVTDEEIDFIVSNLPRFSQVVKWIGLFASLTKEQRRLRMASLRASGAPVSHRTRKGPGPPSPGQPTKQEVLKKLKKGKTKKRKKGK